MDCNRNNTRILYIESNEISILDIPRVLDEMGYDVYKAVLGIRAQEFDNRGCRKIAAAIDDCGVQCAISYDFIITIAQACLEMGIPYVAWVYDSPQKELYTHYAFYPCNYIFAFDRNQVKRLQEIGLKNVFHVPLAIHGEKVGVILDTIGERKKYTSDVTFVGQLYKPTMNAVIQEQIEQYCREMINDCFLKWRRDFYFHGRMDRACVEYWGDLAQHRILQQYPYIEEDFYYEAVLSRLLANKERVYVLNKLAERYNVNFYTKDKDTQQLSDKVKVWPGVGYDEGLSIIYRQSKININITLHCIETGATQRIFDVMAAGGFMLSNYQEELEELFIHGEEIVLFHNESELLELVEYYLTHEEERERIAQRGQQKVLKEHGYKHKLKWVMETVAEREKKREGTYIALQQRELVQQVNALLTQKTTEAYERLYALVRNAIYATAIRKSDELRMLKEMMACWRRERELCEDCNLASVENLTQAAEKYRLVKHALWRIEQRLSEGSCQEALDNLVNSKATKFFIAWMISANICERASTFLGLAHLMAQKSIPEAMEMLTYGALFLDDNGILLQQKADYFMELGLWNEALNTLLKIKEPSTEMVEIINELTGVLGKS